MNNAKAAVCWQKILKHTGLHCTSLQEQCLPLIKSTNSWSIPYMVKRVLSTCSALHIDYNDPSLSPFSLLKIKVQFGARVTLLSTQCSSTALHAPARSTLLLSKVCSGAGVTGEQRLFLWKDFETKPWILSLDTQEVRKGRDGRRAELCLWQYNHVEMCLAEWSKIISVSQNVSMSKKLASSVASTHAEVENWMMDL